MRITSLESLNHAFLFNVYLKKKKPTLSSVNNENQHFINPFPNKPWFLPVCSTHLLKTPWEKDKLLITSNLSFSHSVFYPFG